MALVTLNSINAGQSFTTGTKNVGAPAVANGVLVGQYGSPRPVKIVLNNSGPNPLTSLDIYVQSAPPPSGSGSDATVGAYAKRVSGANGDFGTSTSFMVAATSGVATLAAGAQAFIDLNPAGWHSVVLVPGCTTSGGTNLTVDVSYSL